MNAAVQFAEAIRQAGLVPPEVIEGDGRLRRFASNGKRGDDSGWYVLHDDVLPAGAFGCWRAGLSETWRGNVEQRLSPREEAAHRRRMEELRAQRDTENNARRAEARERATEIWSSSAPATSHPYLDAKQVSSFGLRVHEDSLLIPMRDAAGELHSLQIISPDGEKRFLTGGKVSECYFSIGKPHGKLILAEGYATAASIHAATGEAVAVAFSAGNLTPVARVLRDKFPSIPIVVAGDNDRSGTGQAAANEAASVASGRAVFPDREGMDWNDVFRESGAEYVRSAMDGARAPVGVKHLGPRLSLISGATIEPEVIRWHWDGYLAAGKFHILAGVPGTGKTTLALALASTLSIGGRWPDRSFAPKKNVVIWSGEDDPKDTLVPRLLAMGADMNRIRFVGSVADDNGIRVFDPAADIQLLATAIQDLGDVGLLIVDPIVSAVSGDSHQNAETRRSLQPLVDLGVTADCAVLGISHFTKGSAGKDPLDRVTGSLAFGALPRVVMAAAKKTEEDGTNYRVLVRTKSNIGPDGGGFRYDLEQTILPRHSNISASIAIWGEPIEGSAKEILAEAEQDDDQQGGTDEAVELLEHVLEMGRLSSKEVKQLADRDGITPKALRRAREKLRIQIDRDGFGKDCRTYWSLPVVPQSSSRAQSCPDLNGAQVGTSERKGTSGEVEVVV